MDAVGKEDSRQEWPFDRISIRGWESPWCLAYRVGIVGMEPAWQFRLK